MEFLQKAFFIEQCPKHKVKIRVLRDKTMRIVRSMLIPKSLYLCNYSTTSQFELRDRLLPTSYELASFSGLVLATTSFLSTALTFPSQSSS